MKKRVLSLLLATVMLLSVLSMAGCSSTKTETSEPAQSGEETKAPTQETTNNNEETQPADTTVAPSVTFEDIVFPDSLPANPTQAEEGYYDYDDMSQHYEIELLTKNYGVTPPKDDPIKAWLEEKFNVTITFTTVLADDLENILSTRFSSGDVPDLFMLPSADYGIALGEQGLLVDAREMYPYMPQTCKFVTNAMIQWSSLDDGTIPFITRYATQDGDIWGLAIRQDWLDNLGMDMPSTLDELKEYAHAVTYNDPDGNGQDDTWFMTGAGGGTSFGMLSAFQPFFGNPSEHVENGELASPMLDGTHQGWIGFLHDLYEDGCLAPDWFTIDWETAKSYTLNDKIGMVNYPSDALYWEYELAQGQDINACDNWTFLPSLPEGCKGNPGGNPGELFAVSALNVQDNQGKLLRILHIMDTMTYGGECYLETVQGGGNEVHGGDYGDRFYNEDGTCVIRLAEDHPGYTVYGSDNLALAPWQTFGYTVKYQIDQRDETDEWKHTVDRINEGKLAMASWDKWPNDALLCAVSGDIAPSLSEYETAQFYKFIVGERSMDEWDTFISEWLDQGGRAVLTAKAEKLGVELPDVAK